MTLEEQPQTENQNPDSIKGAFTNCIVSCPNPNNVGLAIKTRAKNLVNGFLCIFGFGSEAGESFGRNVGMGFRLIISAIFIDPKSIADLFRALFAIIFGIFNIMFLIFKKVFTFIIAVLIFPFEFVFVPSRRDESLTKLSAKWHILTAVITSKSVFLYRKLILPPSRKIKRVLILICQQLKSKLIWIFNFLFKVLPRFLFITLPVNIYKGIKWFLIATYHFIIASIKAIYRFIIVSFKWISWCFGKLFQGLMTIPLFLASFLTGFIYGCSFDVFKTCFEDIKHHNAQDPILPISEDLNAHNEQLEHQAHTEAPRDATAIDILPEMSTQKTLDHFHEEMLKTDMAGNYIQQDALPPKTGKEMEGELLRNDAQSSPKTGQALEDDLLRNEQQQAQQNTHVDMPPAYEKDEDLPNPASEQIAPVHEHVSYLKESADYYAKVISVGYSIGLAIPLFFYICIKFNCIWLYNACAFIYRCIKWVLVGLYNLIFSKSTYVAIYNFIKEALLFLFIRPIIAIFKAIRKLIFVYIPQFVTFVLKTLKSVILSIFNGIKKVIMVYIPQFYRLIRDTLISILTGIKNGIFWLLKTISNLLQMSLKGLIASFKKLGELVKKGAIAIRRLFVRMYMLIKSVLLVLIDKETYLKVFRAIKYVLMLLIINPVKWVLTGIKNMLTVHIPNFIVWVAKGIYSGVIWTVKSIYHGTIWTVKSIYHGAIWTVKSIYHGAIWTLKGVYNLAIAIGKGIKDGIVWVGTGIYHILIFIPTIPGRIIHGIVFTAGLISRFFVGFYYGFCPPDEHERGQT